MQAGERPTACRCGGRAVVASLEDLDGGAGIHVAGCGQDPRAGSGCSSGDQQSVAGGNPVDIAGADRDGGVGGRDEVGADEGWRGEVGGGGGDGGGGAGWEGEGREGPRG